MKLKLIAAVILILGGIHADVYAQTRQLIDVRLADDSVSLIAISLSGEITCNVCEGVKPGTVIGRLSAEGLRKFFPQTLKPFKVAALGTVIDLPQQTKPKLSFVGPDPAVSHCQVVDWAGHALIDNQTWTSGEQFAVLRCETEGVTTLHSLSEKEYYIYVGRLVRTQGFESGTTGHIRENQRQEREINRWSRQPASKEKSLP